MIDLVRRGQSSVYGQVSVTVKGNTRTNIAKSSNMDKDSNADGVVDDFVKGTTPGVIATFSLDATEKAQKIEITESTSVSFARILSLGVPISPDEVVSCKASCKIQGNVKILMWVIFKNGGTTVNSVQSSPFTSTSFTELLKENLTVPAGVDNVVISLEVYPNASGDVGIGWFKKLIVEKASAVGSYISTGTKSTNSVRIRSVNEDETKESIAYVNLPQGEELRSVPSAKDELNVVTGVKTQNVSEDTFVSDTVYASLDTSTYTNVDVIKTTAFSLAKAGTTGADGQTHYYNKDGVELAEVAEADIDLEASAGKYYWGEDKKLYIIVAKGDYADIAAARTGLDVTSLNYQLAEPVVTQLDPQPLTIFPNGTQYIEFGTKEVAEYADGINISNAEIPIKAMKTLDKLHIEDGHWKRTAIDLANVAVSPDGLSFTIADAVNGETYEYSYDYDSALSTLPDLEVGEPSLVTRNNRTIVL